MNRDREIDLREEAKKRRDEERRREAERVERERVERDRRLEARRQEERRRQEEQSRQSAAVRRMQLEQHIISRRVTTFSWGNRSAEESARRIEQLREEGRRAQARGDEATYWRTIQERFDNLRD